MMRLMECRKCGGSSFRRENTLWICEYCGAEYLPGDERTEKIEYYVMLAEEAFEKGKYSKMFKYSTKILALDPEYSYAWIMQMYYYGLQGDTKDTVYLIDAGKKAIKYEKNDLLDTRLRVNKAFLDWGKSGAFNARSHISIFYLSILKDEKRKQTGHWDSENKQKDYAGFRLSALNQLQAAVKVLKEIDTGFLMGDEFGDHFLLQEYYCKNYREALIDCERAILVMKKSCQITGDDEFSKYDYSYCKNSMDELWKKIGEKRPGVEQITEL